jgi:hypothetical protein
LNIEDLVIDPDDGSMMFAVLGFGGFLGVGDKYFAVPWDAFELSKDRKKSDAGCEQTRSEEGPGVR